MQELAKNIYIEDKFPGVTLGVINLPQGQIQIDAPPAPEDTRSWRASLLNLGGGMERLLVNLDAHPDRTIGARAMDSTVVAHEKAAQVFRNRPNTFKAQGDETGADWEAVIGLGSVRWAPPEITFTHQMNIEWNNVQIILEHHAGPSTGAIWVKIPQHKIVFVGDAVIKHQPPFFSSAHIPVWLESLEELSSPKFKGYTIISGRGGTITPAYVKTFADYLKGAYQKLEKLAKRKAGPDSTEKMVEPLLAAIKSPASKHKQYSQRLRNGLHHYYVRRYRLSSHSDDD